MLRSAIPVVQEVFRQFPDGGIDLETLTRIVVGVTGIDRINFVRYDARESNPVLGEFRRYRQVDAPYASEISGIEIRYASHLSVEDRRFVVCKELCHALEEPDGKHVTDDGIDDLVATFSLLSGDDQPEKIAPAFGVEVLAMVTAIEILCPLPLRKKLNGAANLEEIARRCVLPLRIVQSAVRPAYVSSCETLLRNYGISVS
jgi:hypothetical protein